VIVNAPLFLAGTILLVVTILISRRSVRSRFDDASVFSDETVGQEKWDSLSMELGAQIFSSEDLDFVGRNCTSEFLRRFQKQRTALALEWLEQVRCEIDRSMGEHVRAARMSPTLRTADELKLAVEFLLFHLLNRALSCAVWLHGPLAAGNLVRYSTRLAGELKAILENFPVAGSATVEVISDDPKGSVVS
jgi:hypothetical protein